MDRHLTRGLAVLAAAALTLTACAEGAAESSPPAVAEPVAITYDGGIVVLDGESLAVAHNVALPGFNRVNPAGDGTRIVVSTDSGFQVLDAAAGRMTGVGFPGEKPGHVVLHGDRTVLFTDGTGEVHSFDPRELAAGKPQGRKYRTAQPHHGVAVELAGGTLIVTLGSEESRTGAIALDRDGTEVARNEQCPGVHGEAVAKGDVVSLGCKDGVLLFRNGAFVKIKSAGAYGAVGTQAGSPASPVLLADYMVEEDAEFEAPAQFALVDAAAGTLRVVPMPKGVSYSFRSLARGPGGEALILGTDGKLHVIDPATGTLTASWPLITKWTEPTDWQEPRPALFVRGADAYVTEPASSRVLKVDLTTGGIVATTTLPAVPNELTGTTT